MLAKQPVRIAAPIKSTNERRVRAGCPLALTYVNDECLAVAVWSSSFVQPHYVSWRLCLVRFNGDPAFDDVIDESLQKPEAAEVAANGRALWVEKAVRHPLLVPLGAGRP